ncbi:MAG: hypothetical protein K2M48_00695 [Clostridiales bacterium]|nr:hypothetical protein [Clostridiales bacterium]
MAKIKTINFRFLFWFGIVFAIGAFAASFMGYSVATDDFVTIWPMYLGIGLFGAFGFVGMIGTLVLLRKHLILKSVLKRGKQTVGEFERVGRVSSWSTNRRYGHGTTTWFNQIIFTYLADGVEREYKSCTVYLDKQVEMLKEIKTFPVKYKGKHAIICEEI